jgi:acetoin utilization protein AcuC
MTGKTALVYNEELLKYDFGPFHPLKPERLALTFELIKGLSLLDVSGSSLCSPRIATLEEILLFHTLDYVKQVQEASEKGTGRLDLGDTPAFKGCYEVSCLVAGATLEAIDLVMTEKFEHAFSPGGGLHHAHKDRASGFCIFNDAAIGIAYLKNHYDLKRIMYVDVDAHHGDGVMYGFYRDPSLLDIDFHEDGNYLFPGTGQTTEIGEGLAKGLKINLPLPPFTSDRSFIYAFNKLVPKLAAKFKPEFVILQCGADAHAEDGLAHLSLTTATYESVTSTIHEIAHRFCGGRLVALGGGGYNLSNTSRCWSIVYSRLIGAKCPEKIPSAWKTYFESITKEKTPQTLRDIAIERPGKKDLEVSNRVSDMVHHIENTLGI